MDEDMRKLIHDEASEDQMTKHARKSSQSLMENGFDRVLAGETSLDEVFRVTQA